MILYCVCGAENRYASIKPITCSCCGASFASQFKPTVVPTSRPAPTQDEVPHSFYQAHADTSEIPRTMEIAVDGQAFRPVARGRRFEPRFTTVKDVKDGGDIGAISDRGGPRESTARTDDSGNVDAQSKVRGEYRDLFNLKPTQ